MGAIGVGWVSSLNDAQEARRSSEGLARFCSSGDNVRSGPPELRVHVSGALHPLQHYSGWRCRMSRVT